MRKRNLQSIDILIKRTCVSWWCFFYFPTQKTFFMVFDY